MFLWEVVREQWINSFFLKCSGDCQIDFGLLAVGSVPNVFRQPHALQLGFCKQTNVAITYLIVVVTEGSLSFSFIRCKTPQLLLDSYCYFV